MPDEFLPDGSLCPPNLLLMRYGRPTHSELVPPKKSWKHGDTYGLGKDLRTPTEHDRDRTLYSTHFQRLQGVTQVVSPHPHGGVFHNRLLHSLKVASLSKAISQNQLRMAFEDGALRERILFWGGLDAAACETAGLAHDIGHPPFGHAAEGVLDAWLKRNAEGRLGSNGFEGNAQSFRAITYLERKALKSSGLELTAVSLAAVLKYPWTRDEADDKRNAKFGAIDADRGVFDKARSWTTEAHLTDLSQTLEASIMDIADDITYAVHDLQDFILAGIIRPEVANATIAKVHAYVNELELAETNDREPGAPPSEVAPFIAKMERLRKFYPTFFSISAYKSALMEAVAHVEALSADVQTQQPLAQMRSAGADLIASFVAKIQVADPKTKDELNDQPRVFLEPDAWHLVQVLKDVTKAFVVETPRLGLHQAAQIESLTELLDKLFLWVQRGETSYLPPRLVAYLLRGDAGKTSDGQKRAIVDFCCLLTDEEAHRMSLQLRGFEVPPVY